MARPRGNNKLIEALAKGEIAFQPKIRHNAKGLIEQLTLWRYRRGMPVTTLGRKAGFNHSTIVHWENGHCFPNLINLITWAEALGVEITFYIDEPSTQGNLPLQGGIDISRKK